MAHDSHIVRAEENLKLSHGRSSYRQASRTNPPIKAFIGAVIESEALPTVMQLKRKPKTVNWLGLQPGRVSHDIQVISNFLWSLI